MRFMFLLLAIGCNVDCIWADASGLPISSCAYQSFPLPYEDPNGFTWYVDENGRFLDLYNSQTVIDLGFVYGCDNHSVVSYPTVGSYPYNDFRPQPKTPFRYTEGGSYFWVSPNPYLCTDNDLEYTKGQPLYIEGGDIVAGELSEPDFQFELPIHMWFRDSNDYGLTSFGQNP